MRLCDENDDHRMNMVILRFRKHSPLRIYILCLCFGYLKIDFLLQFYCEILILQRIHIHYHPSLSNQNCIGWKHAYSSKYSEDSPSGWAQSNKPSAWHHHTLLLIWIQNYSELSDGILDVFYLKKKKVSLHPLYPLYVYNSST